MAEPTDRELLDKWWQADGTILRNMRHAIAAAREEGRREGAVEALAESLVTKLTDLDLFDKWWQADGIILKNMLHAAREEGRREGAAEAHRLWQSGALPAETSDG